MKPVACGNQRYSMGTFNSAATISAILFSKPSPFSLENGMLAGSAHTRRERRLTRSLRCPSAARAGGAVRVPTAMPSNAAAIRIAPAVLLGAKAGLLMLVGSCGLIGALGRAPARQAALGARLEVDVDVVDVAHHVGIIAERRHHVLLGGVHVLAAAGDDLQEVRIAHGLHRLHQGGCVGGALAVGAVAD